MDKELTTIANKSINENIELAILIKEKDNEIERLNTDKEQLNSLVNSCQEEIRRLNKKIEIKNNRIQQLMNRTRSARIDKAIAFIKSEKAIKCSGIPIKNFEAYENYLLSVLEGSE